MVITVAIPCYKSAKTLPVVVEGIRKAFAERPAYSCQLILVNDGSPDDGATTAVIKEICEKDPSIIGIELGKNYGQSAARMAAFPYAEGDVLVYLDDDGQHDPNDLFKLVNAIENGMDLAYADFHGKKHTLFKRFTSWLNGEILSATIHKPKNIHTSSFVAFSSYLIKKFKEYRSPYISFIGFALQHTSRIVNVPITHHERMEGKSGYTLRKMFALFGDGLFSFSIVPLRLIGLVGFVSLAVSILFYIAAIIVACLHHPAGTLVVLGCAFLIGAALLFGEVLIGEYLGRNCMIQNQLPQYSVREVLNHKKIG